MKLISALVATALGDFVAQPTGGVRPCEFYSFTASASFTNGFTETNADAMHDGATEVTGDITLTQTGCQSGVQITGTISGLAEGTHGWHVHSLGNAQNGCGSAFTGGHWNPYGAPMGGVDAPKSKREVGQIGNIECDANGDCVVDVTDSLIRLHGLRNVVGRSLVIHQNPDGGEAGGSGGRVACASIIWTEMWTET